MTQTIRLYDTDPYGRSFTGRVLSAVIRKDRKKKDMAEVILDRTLFFPEEGGQTPDRGTLDGLNVTDVQIRDGVITHTVTGPPEALALFASGKEVRGELDFDRRFSNMQNHSGEHILSGLIYSRYGFPNVGFRLSDNTVTLDFGGHLEEDQIRSLEREANEVVYRNLEIRAEYPDPEVLKTLFYRSKTEIDGPVRIVTIEGVDSCACCAPHVARTGEIGVIRILKVLREKHSTRLTILCGRRALLLMQDQLAQLEAVSHLTSRSQDALADGVRHLLEENEAARFRIGQLERRLTEMRAAAVPREEEHVFLSEEDMGAPAQRGLVNALMEDHPGYCGVFVGNDRTGYAFIIGSRTRNCRAAAGLLRKELGARGGGKPEMVQGRADRSWEEIHRVLAGLSQSG